MSEHLRDHVPGTTYFCTLTVVGWAAVFPSTGTSLWPGPSCFAALLVRGVPPAMLRESRTLFLLVPGLCMVAKGISFVEPMWSFYFFLLTPFFHRIPARRDKHLPQR